MVSLADQSKHCIAVCVGIARVFLAITFSLFLVAGCASTLSSTGDSGEVLVFAVPEEVAFSIIRDSMLPVAREGTVQRVESPNKGYSGIVKLGLDKDTIPGQHHVPVYSGHIVNPLSGTNGSEPGSAVPSPFAKLPGPTVRHPRAGV